MTAHLSPKGVELLDPERSHCVVAALLDVKFLACLDQRLEDVQRELVRNVHDVPMLSDVGDVALENGNMKELC